jgi:RNA 2',3'-cyclic 3'-phosphodiesterase
MVRILTLMNAQARANHTDVNERWRVFVAAPVPDPVRRVMQHVQNSLAARRWPVRWVDPRLAHITLRFFGDTPRAHLDVLREDLSQVAQRHDAMQLHTSSVGAFPSATRARVLWLGLNGQVTHLAALARDVEAIGPRAGGDDRKRPFKPHITLARLRDGSSPPADFSAAIAELDLPTLDLTIDRIDLVRSVLGPKGPTYTTIASFPLGTPATVATPASTPELREHG